MPRPRIQQLPPRAEAIYEGVADLPIISPHGHCDPAWFAHDTPFPDPASLLIVPDHYVFRMLYSHGVPLGKLGMGVAPEDRDPRAIFRLFAQHWHLFLGTPSRGWMEHTLYRTLGVETELTRESADAVYDQIDATLKRPEWRPRAAFAALNIARLATTDAALGPLIHHATLAQDWTGHILPTFRPDDILNPARPGHRTRLRALARLTGLDCADYAKFLDAIRARRALFRSLGATATDHDAPELMTRWLPRDEITALHAKVWAGKADPGQARAYYGHMLTEMAQMSADDGLVMQIHAGSRRSTNHALAEEFGADKGADIPVAMDWTRGLEALLNRVGNDPRFRLLVFTLDEATYARELAPMAGHWPCLRLGPPWWFHDSINGIRRYLDRVVETAGYYNLAGFNDDTRAFLSIPARHDMWRRGVAMHLSDQIERGLLSDADAGRLAPWLACDAALAAYRMGPDG